MLSEHSKTIILFFTFLHFVFLQVPKAFRKWWNLVFWKKQSKASCSWRPTSSDLTNRNQPPSIASSNFRVVFEDHPSYNEEIPLMINFLISHPLFGAFNSFNDVVPIPTLFKCAFSAFRPNSNPQEVYLNLIGNSLVILSKAKFLDAINLCVLHSTKLYSPSTNDIISTLYQMGIRRN